MSALDPSNVPSNLEQQRKRAKDLLRAARSGDPAAVARVRSVRSDAGTAPRMLKLADAQLAVAREAGYASWPALVAAIEERDVQAFCEAVNAGDGARVQQLLAWNHVRRRVNDPMFVFGQRAAHVAAGNVPMLKTLIAAGADLNLRSEWDNGPYTVLDNADEPAVRFLLSQGAELTAHVAARLGWSAELQALVDAEPTVVHARGGDGQQPLHLAKTVAVADFLLDRGAGIDVPCIDHKTTPAQYALVDRPDVCRRLLERGARPDIFMAARLGDSTLAGTLIDADPTCLAARIDGPGYAPVPPLHIYCWTLGVGKSPHEVALDFGHRDVHDLLLARSPDRVTFVEALRTGNASMVNTLLARAGSLLQSLTPADHSHLAYAIFHERFDAADLMLRLGFDPAAPGQDGGTALHAACWVGSVRMVERIIALGVVPLDAPDPTHHSPPLGWAAFGSVHRRARGADYPAVIDRLVAAGADIHAVGNRNGLSLVEMAKGNKAVQEALRRHGAR